MGPEKMDAPSRKNHAGMRSRPVAVGRRLSNTLKTVSSVVGERERERERDVVVTSLHVANKPSALIFVRVCII